MNNQFTRCLSSRDAFNRDCRLTTIFSSRMRRHKRARFEKRTARFHRKIWEEFASQIERPVASGFPQSSEGLGSLFLFRSLESRFDGTLAAFVFLPRVDAFSTQYCSSLYSSPGTFWSGFSYRYATIVLYRTGVHGRYIVSFVFSSDTSTLLVSNTFTDIYDSSIQLFCLDFKWRYRKQLSYFQVCIF